MAPEAKINVPPINHILFRDLVFIKRAIKNKRIHIAQGFNPSKAPKIMVVAGKESFERSTLPKNGILIFWEKFPSPPKHSFKQFSIFSPICSLKPIKYSFGVKVAGTRPRSF